MSRRSQIIQTKAGNNTVGISDRRGDGYEDEAGSEISIFPMNNKGIHSEGLFLNLDRPGGSVSVAEEMVAGRA